MRQTSRLKKMILMANFTAVAIVLSLIESSLAIVPVPGAKIGFANLLTLGVIYIYGFKEGMTLTLLRILVVSLLSGRLLGPTFYMSLAGGILATIVMGIGKKINFFGIVGVSVLGALFHVLGQITAGIFVISSTAIIYYLPIMLAIGLPAGVLTGLIASRFVKVWQTRQEIQ